MNATILDVLGIISPFISVMVALIAFRRTQKQGDDKAGREMGQILTEIGYIKSSIDSISRKLEYQEERFITLVERVSAVEQSAKSAHHRIDTIIKNN